MNEYCNDCKYAKWDYDSCYGGYKQWFFVECMKNKELDNDEECDEYSQYDIMED